MKVFELDPNNPESDLVGEIVSLLREGGIVAYPTDTLYGLGGDALNPDVVRRIATLKGRDGAKPFPYIIDAADRLEKLNINPGRFGEAIAKRFWPGPVSLVLDGSGRLPGHLLDRRRTICLRVPENNIARSMARRLDGLLVATSANPGGMPPARSANNAIDYFRGEIDAVVDGGPSPSGSPSTIVDVSEGKVVILREGAVAAEKILTALAETLEKSNQ